MKKFIIIFSLFILPILSNGSEVKKGNLEQAGVFKALKSVINSCYSAANQTTAKFVITLKKSMSDKEINEKMTTFVLDYHNTQLKLCLEVSAFKIQETANSIKVDSK